jgi:endonuclease YncB( thermonuclease family)
VPAVHTPPARAGAAVDGCGAPVGGGGYAPGRLRASREGAPGDLKEAATSRPRHGGARLLAVALLAVALAGCDAAAPPGGGGADGAPAGLATTRAERAAWPGPPRDAVAAEVQRVTDGDTFVATVDGRRERVRVIGVDTPETVAPNRPDEPYGREASSFAKRHLTGATVRLAGDVEPRDRYGRLLAYVWLADGTFWNALLAAEGYAQQLTIPPNVTYAGLLRRLVAQARQRERGLWATQAAAGDSR